MKHRFITFKPSAKVKAKL